MLHQDRHDAETRFFAHLLIQVTVEQQTDEALWAYLDAPAVAYRHAVQLAPDLPAAVDAARRSHESSERRSLLLSEQEKLAQETAHTLPQTQRSALARAARIKMAALLASA